MFEIKHDSFFMTIDQLEEDGVLVASSYGYRLDFNTYRKYTKSPKLLKNEIKLEYSDLTFEENPHQKKRIEKRIDDNRKRKEKRIVKEASKQGEETKLISLKPRMTGNLAVDIVTTIGFNLSGDRFQKGRYLPSWISIHDIIENLSESYVFLD